MLALTLSLFLPHPITVAGTGVGDIGPAILGFSRFLAGDSPYGIHVNAGPLAGYPFTTMLLVSPFAFVPLPLIAPLFCGLSGGLLAWAILRRGPAWRLLMFASFPFVSALHSVQWSPLMTAAILFSPLLPLALAKPQLAVVMLATGRWSRWTLGVSAGIVVLSLILLPSWPKLWLSEGTLNLWNGRIPVTVFPGFLLILSALFWRSASGRLLMMMSIVGQRYFYEMLLLFLIPRTLIQMVTLTALSWTVAGATLMLGWWQPQSGDQDPRVWVAVVCGIYLPALAMVAWQHRKEIRTRARAWGQTRTLQ